MRRFGQNVALAGSGMVFLLAMAGTSHADVLIAAKQTQHMKCTDRVCSPTAKQAILNVADIANMLAGGDVRVVSSKLAPDIGVRDALSWTSAHRLSLDAYRAITFSSAVTIAGEGAVELRTNDGGADGDFSFVKKGHIEFWSASSSLTINGSVYRLVGSIAELVQAATDNSGGSFALARSYDAKTDGTYKQSPVAQLKGVFEGLGNGIANFSLSLKGTEPFGGLFGLLFPSSAVRDLSLQGVHISAANASGELMGALGGDCYGLIKGITVTGRITGSGRQDTVGGIAGEIHGTVMNGRTQVAIDNAAVAGGIVGNLLAIGGAPAIIANSWATGDISGETAGGLAGTEGDTVENISNSFATGNIGRSDTVATSLGGLVGRGGGSISASFATGNVSAAECTACGGLLGTSLGSLANSYALGGVISSACDACGGLIGANSGSVATAYTAGAVTATGGLAGGVIGNDTAPTGSLSEVYWDLDATGIGDPGKGAGNLQNDPGLTGLTDAQLKSGLPSGFRSKLWKEDGMVNAGLPYLRSNAPP